MGLTYKETIQTPQSVYWKVCPPGLQEGSEEDVNDNELTLRTFLKEQQEEKDRECVYITQIRQIVWGEQHGLILDKKGRLFSMGRNINGVLGLKDK
jgi:alpha-tubulin suppressor-like RCC1 family protein